LVVVVAAAAADSDGMLAPAHPGVPSLSTLTTRDAGDAEVQEMARFAVAELKKLSSSGVYETLELRRVLSASAGEGIFHYNYLLEIEVASRHLKDGVVSKHRVLVMCNLEDGSLSLAIDDFPEMDDDAIESFWVARVESHRRSREASFRGMELEWLERHGDDGGAATPPKRPAAEAQGADTDIASLRRRSTRDLRKMLRDPLVGAALKATLRDVLDTRWEKLEELELHDEL